jgi:hypothetical protein
MLDGAGFTASATPAVLTAIATLIPATTRTRNGVFRMLPPPCLQPDSVSDPRRC